MKYSIKRKTCYLMKSTVLISSVYARCFKVILRKNMLKMLLYSRPRTHYIYTIMTFGYILDDGNITNISLKINSR